MLTFEIWERARQPNNDPEMVFVQVSTDVDEAIQVAEELHDAGREPRVKVPSLHPNGQPKPYQCDFTRHQYEEPLDGSDPVDPWFGLRQHSESMTAIIMNRGKGRAKAGASS